ncbi:PEP-utilizing enzyme [Tepidiforma sp.]|uniref:PEP-utilizing enzyme n=1 Tax=Tepidiforma sp. TaxID=2682230 RepID=UPI002ADDA661|nr:PEP-utilizing enzyme [Tepidiforma sp.]
MKPWVVGSRPSERYPLWTRANVGEVFPDPVAPLSFSLVMAEDTELAWRDALVRMGAFTYDEFDPDNMETVGVFGGYCYLNAQVTRILGERAPGLSAQAMDDLFYGAQPGVPPYEPSPGDQNEARTADLAKTFEWAMSVQELERPALDAKRIAGLRAARPELENLSNEALWAYSKGIALANHRRLFGEHIFTTFVATVPVGAVTQICAAVGRPADALRVIQGVGDVASAAPSLAMWEMGRMIAADRELTAAFDAGVAGVLDRVRGLGEAGQRFLAAFDAFLYEFGCRGPNEWESRCHTWETKPELALAAIDRMRLAPDSAAPAAKNAELAAERERVTQEIAAMLAGDPQTQGLFLAAARAARVFQAGRERTKTNNIRMIHEMRMAMHTVGRRMVAAGHLEEEGDYAFLLADEVDDWLQHPAKYVDTIAERKALYHVYNALQEPFVFWGEIPDPATWPKKADVAFEPAKPGDVLQGYQGCAGKATGRARVVLDPLDPRGLEPGDILVAPITDPSWTPLFVPAAAVVVDVGAAQSHAMIVSRELGIPCVPSVTNATKRIPDGATIAVDGDAGTVTVLALP